MTHVEIKALFGFKKMVTHHSVFIIHHSSLITHHSKYPNFLPYLFGTYFQCLITQFFLLFMGPIPEHYVISSISLPAFHLTLFISFSSPFSHRCPVTVIEAILFLFHFSCTHTSTRTILSQTCGQTIINIQTQMNTNINS